MDSDLESLDGSYVAVTMDGSTRDSSTSMHSNPEAQSAVTAVDDAMPPGSMTQEQLLVAYEALQAEREVEIQDHIGKVTTCESSADQLPQRQQKHLRPWKTSFERNKLRMKLHQLLYWNRHVNVIALAHCCCADDVVV